MRTYQEKFSELPLDEQRSIKKRAEELIAEERTWRKLRKAVRRSRETSAENSAPTAKTPSACNGMQTSSCLPSLSK